MCLITEIFTPPPFFLPEDQYFQGVYVDDSYLYFMWNQKDKI